MKQKRIFIINGYPSSGKTTFGRILNKFVPCEHISIIDSVKEEAVRLGWNPDSKNEIDRKFLSDLKDVTTKYNDFPFRELTKKVISFISHDEKEILLIDIREPMEIDRAINTFGGKSIIIDRKNNKKVTSNHADANIDNYNYDYIIKNYGSIDDFTKEIKKFADELKG